MTIDYEAEVQRFVQERLLAENLAIERAAVAALLSGCGVHVDRTRNGDVVVTVDRRVPPGELHEHVSNRWTKEERG